MPKNTLDDYLIVKLINDISVIRKKLKYWSFLLLVVYGILNVSIIYYFKYPQALKGFFEYRETEIWYLELFINACLPTWTFYLTFLFVKIGIVPKELALLARKEFPRKNLWGSLSSFFSIVVLIPLALFLMGSIITMFFLDLLLPLGYELIFDQYIIFKDNDLIIEGSAKIFILMWLTWINYSFSIDELKLLHSEKKQENINR